MSTKVFLANVSTFKGAELFDSLYGLMPADRKNKIDEKKFAKDKNLSLGVGVLLEVAKDEFQVAKTINETSEGIEQNFYYNLSHSGEMAMCIASDHECGCDIELKRDGTLDIADRFFYGKEARLIADQKSEVAKKDLFFRLWTLKESFMKATRLGFKLPLNEFCVVPTTEGNETYPSLDADIKLTQHVNNSKYKFFEYDIKNLLDCRDDYACSICLKNYNGEKPDIEVIDFTKVELQ